MKKILCFFLAFTGISFLYAQKQDSYSQVSFLNEAGIVGKLQAAGFDFDHPYLDAGTNRLSIVFKSTDTPLLRRAGFNIRVDIADMAADFLERNKHATFHQYDTGGVTTSSRLLFNSPDQAFANIVATPVRFTEGTMGGYYKLAEIKQKIDDLKAAYSDLVRIDTIGYTILGKPVWCVKMSDNVNTDETDEAEVFYSGLHHAREPMSMMNVIFFMQYLLENYQTNARIKEIVDNRQLYFVPCVNPDGYFINETTNPSGGGQRRKNASTNGGSNGVDLNRNYGYTFGYDNTGSSGTPSSDTYRGPSAFSELETVAIRNFLRTRRIKIALNNHAYGNLYPHSPEVDTVTVTTAETANIASLAAVQNKFNGFIAGTPIQTVGYSVNGASGDYFFKADKTFRGNIYNFSPEIGTGTFWPAQNLIIPLCKAVFYGNVQAALAAGPYAKAEDAGSMALTQRTGNFAYTAQRLGYTDAPVIISILPIENVLPVTEKDTIASMANVYDEVQGTIAYELAPAVTNGSRIRFVLKVESNGITVLDTITKFFNPQILFSDDMETGVATDKWTVTNGWGYTTGGAFGGTRSFSESPSGNYNANSTRTALCNTTFNLSDAVEAYISYRIKYVSENANDKLQLQLSPNGSTYTPVTGLNTIVENIGTIGSQPSFCGRQLTWLREQSGLATVVGNAAARFRFVFTSNSSVNADGFYLDNVEVLKLTATILPVHDLRLWGIKEGAAVKLEWQGTADEAHSYFEVQHSADGTIFTDAGTIRKGAPFNFLHNYPVNGNNYYRLKQVDKNGHFVYSNVITVYFLKGKLLLQPVPAASTLTVNYNAAAAASTIMRVTDINGRMIFSSIFNIKAGNNISAIDVSRFAPGTYWLLIAGTNGAIITRQVFQKQ